MFQLISIKKISPAGSITRKSYEFSKNFNSSGFLEKVSHCSIFGGAVGSMILLIYANASLWPLGSGIGSPNSLAVFIHNFIADFRFVKALECVSP